MYRQAYKLAKRGQEFVEDLDTGKSKKNWYYFLGLPPTAGDDMIRKSYRALTWCFHPDRQLGEDESEKEEAEALFKLVVDAYEVLSDPEKRRKFDQCRPNIASLYPAKLWLTEIPEESGEPWETEDPVGNR